MPGRFLQVEVTIRDAIRDAMVLVAVRHPRHGPLCGYRQACGCYGACGGSEQNGTSHLPPNKFMVPFSFFGEHADVACVGPALVSDICESQIRRFPSHLTARFV